VDCLYRRERTAEDRQEARCACPNCQHCWHMRGCMSGLTLAKAYCGRRSDSGSGNRLGV